MDPAALTVLWVSVVFVGLILWCYLLPCAIKVVQGIPTLCCSYCYPPPDVVVPIARVQSSHGEEEESKSPDEDITAVELAACKIVTSESFDSFDAVIAVAEHKEESKESEEENDEEVSRAIIVPVMTVERRRAQVFSRGEEE